MRQATSKLTGIAIAVASFLSLSAPAEAVTLGADYTMSVFGLPALKLDLSWKADGEAYSVDGKIRSAGIGHIFGGVDGTLEARGQVTDKGWQPSRFAMRYSGKDPWRGSAEWSGDRLADFVTEPVNSRKDDGNWVPLEGKARSGLSDLFSGLVIQAGDESAVCGRTLALFDGEMRMTLALSAPRRMPITVQGGPKQGVQCNVRFTPVAGYSPNSSSRRHLAKQTIKIVWANVTGEYWVPASAIIPHKDATLRINATRLSGNG